MQEDNYMIKMKLSNRAYVVMNFLYSFPIKAGMVNCRLIISLLNEKF